MPRWSIVRLITGKELRDLLRDRRTVLLILVLPAALYPLFGAAAWLFATTLLSQQTRIGVIGAEHLPADPAGLPPLLVGDRFAPGLADAEPEAGGVAVRRLTGDPDDALRDRAADAVLVVPPGTADALRRGDRAKLTVRSRDGDDKSKLAARRLTAAVRTWEGRLKEARFAARGLPPDFDRVIDVEDPQAEKPRAKKAADEIRDTFARVFPFILVMWLLAGAIQPAVDMTAGEKERGTMETLLISPAERSEIVLGKFLAATAFSFTSVVWNVLWLAVVAFLVERFFGYPIVNPAGLAGSVVFGLPLAMLFSAVCLALGVFARSTKEGQYYLLPLILVSMPLAFWALTPGVELGPDNCWVPVTGAMLLQSRLLAVAADPLPWGYVLPVIGGLAGWIALALGLAVVQFRREGVLFREVGPTGGGLAGLFRRATGSDG